MAGVFYPRALPRRRRQRTPRGRPFRCVVCGSVPCVSGVPRGSPWAALLSRVWLWDRRGGKRASSAALSSPRSPPPNPVCCPRLSPCVTDVVDECSPGPGLSCARRGTDIHGEWDRSSRSVRGPLASPPPLGWCVEGRGAESGPTSRLSPRPGGVGWWLSWSFDVARRPSPARPWLGWLCGAGCCLSRGGAGFPCRYATRLPSGTRARDPAFCGAPGALQVVCSVARD